MAGTRRQVLAIVVVLIAMPAWSYALAQDMQRSFSSSTSASPAVICTALEVHINAQSGVTLVLFHQRDKADQARLASLLAGGDGSSVQVQTGQSEWVNASVVRLRDCFGRGLLVFPSSALKLKDGDAVTVKFGGSSTHS
jgi:hypothetical protein